MSKQGVVGTIVALVGLFLLYVVAIPTFEAVRMHTATIPLPGMSLLLLSLGTFGFGLWMIPFSGFGPTFTNVYIALGSPKPPWFGGKRSDDPNADGSPKDPSQGA